MLSSFKLSLRPYQVEAIEQVAELVAAGERRILVTLPTGAGKTCISAYLMAQYAEQGFNVGFMVERRNLVEQASDRLRSCGVRHGIFMAGHDYYAHEPVQIISRDTLHERCFRTDRMHKPGIDILFRDEAHCGVTPTDREIYAGYPNLILVGVTATPALGDGTSLGFVFTKLVQPRTFQQLIDEKYLLPNTIYQPRQFDDGGLKIRSGDFVMGDAAAGEIAKQNPIGDVIRDWKKLGQDRATICFCPTIKHANWIAEQFSAAGIQAASVTMDTSLEERQEIYERSRDGKLKIITSVEVLSRGADLPWVGCCIHLRPFRSPVPWIQAAGRANRPWCGQDHAVQIDHVGNVTRLGFPEDVERWSLSPGEPPARMKQDRDCEPAICGQCQAAKPKPGRCPACGWEPPVREPPSEKLEFEPGSLVRARRKRVLRSDEQRNWDKALGIAIYKGWSCRQALWLYKKLTGGDLPGTLNKCPTNERQWSMNARDFYNAFHRVKK